MYYWRGWVLGTYFYHLVAFFCVLSSMHRNYYISAYMYMYMYVSAYMYMYMYMYVWFIAY